MDNYCKLCFKEESGITIDFNDIKIENGKILQLLEKINEHNDYNNDILKNNANYYEKLSQEED